MRGSRTSKIQIEAMQTHERRIPLIKKIQDRFQKTVLVYQTSFSFENGLISDEDATMLEEVLLGTRVQKGLLLIINSSGGFGLAAERITHVCRKYSPNGFEVLVPNKAKSAATIVCFGADKIWMGETSELGPIDPQLRLQRRMVSVHNILKSYDDLLTRASKTKGRIEPYLQQLSVYDPRYIEQLKQEVKLSEAMAIKLLKAGMLKGKTIQNIKQCIQMFVNPDMTLEHGRPIYHKDASQCGMNIASIKTNDPIWEVIWELQLRYDWVMSRLHGKAVESVDNSFTLHGENYEN